jgi:hypothetical protein
VEHAYATYRRRLAANVKEGEIWATKTTDSGIDLVMYVPGTRDALTVQVKTAIQPFRDGGTGPLVMGWFFPRTCKAQWLARVDISRDSVWLLPIEDALRHARGNTADVMLYWRLEPPPGPVIGVESDFDQYRFDAVIDRLLGGEATELP